MFKLLNVTLESSFIQTRPMNQNLSNNHLTKRKKIFKLHIKRKKQKLCHDP